MSPERSPDAHGRGLYPRPCPIGTDNALLERLRRSLPPPRPPPELDQWVPRLLRGPATPASVLALSRPPPDAHAASAGVLRLLPCPLCRSWAPTSPCGSRYASASLSPPTDSPSLHMPMPMANNNLTPSRGVAAPAPVLAPVPMVSVPTPTRTGTSTATTGPCMTGSYRTGSRTGWATSPTPGTCARHATLNRHAAGADGAMHLLLASSLA
jgi:hypothetical protein